MSVFVMKLSTGNVVVNDNGRVNLITPPVGVSLHKCGKTFHWKAAVIKDRRSRSISDWTTVTVTTSAKGVLEAFYDVIDVRKQSIGFLLNSRLLKRIRQGDPEPRKDGHYRVYDPFDRIVVRLPNRSAAVEFNNEIITRYIENHQVREDELVEVIHG